MRALYFLLAGAATRLRYLRPGLAVILAAVAVKLLLADAWEFPAWSAPAFIAAVLAVVAALSARSARGERHQDAGLSRAPSSRLRAASPSGRP
jgi:tellurite resistance protein TerC